MSHSNQTSATRLEEIARDPHHWSRLVPMTFIILSLISLVLVPLLVRRHTENLRAEMRVAVEPAGYIADRIEGHLATELSLLIAFQVTEQPQYIRMYQELVAQEREAYAELEPLAREIGGPVEERLEELRAAEVKWHGSIAESEFIRRHLPGPVFLTRLFERIPALQDTQTAARQLSNAVQMEMESRRTRIRRAEGLNVTMAIILTFLALVSALLVARLGRQMRRLAEEATQQRQQARREASEAELARNHAETAEKRAAFLADASRELSMSLDYPTIMQRVTQMAIPTLCDFCVIDVVTDQRKLERVASAHRTERQQRALTISGEPRYASLDPIRQVLEQGTPLLLDPLTPEMQGAFAAVPGSEDLVAGRSAILAPLVTPQRVLGVMIFVSSDSRRNFTPVDVAFIEEFTRRVALAAENARLYAESQQAVRSREEILAIVSHDLRSPLTTITMTTSMLSEMPPPPEELPEQFDAIRLAARRMTRLINDLLDVTTIDIGHRLPIDRSEVDIPSFFAEVSGIFRPQAANRNVTLHWKADLSNPILNADRDRLIQALSNLVGNALKFTPEGGTVRVRATEDDDAVRFSVSDDGPGIPGEHVQRIFDPYWQMKRTARMGAGLGLPIARGIVESHGGRIWVESDGANGSTFLFTIPRKDPEPDSPGPGFSI